MSTDQPALYRIRIEGRLDPSWSDRMAGMAIEVGKSETTSVTILTGELSDQAALHGVLNTLFELHMPILSTERLAAQARSSRAGPDRGREGRRS